MLSIDKSLPIIEPKIYLCKPNKQIIGKLKEAYEINHKVNLGEINELSFQLPYFIELNNELVANPHIVLCNVKYLIKFVRGNFEEYYQINKKTDNMKEASDYLELECFSLPIELKNKKIVSYTKEVVNAEEILTDVIKTAYEVNDIVDALWTIDYIYPFYNTMYRSFEIFEKTLQDFILEDITETFDDSMIIFNTLERTISLYHKDQLDDNKGLTFNKGKYLKTLSQEENTDEFITRLKVFGKDDLSIQEVNPTGKNYVEDFTFFTDPYEETLLGTAVSGTNTTNIKIINHGLTTGDYIVNKTRYVSRMITRVDNDNFTVDVVTGQTAGDSIYEVNTHATFMSDELCSALIDYNTLLEASYQIEDVTESGTTITNIKMTAHGLTNGDWILNKTNNEHRKVTVVDVDNITVEDILYQTSGDIIYKYKDGTLRKLLYGKEELESELTVLENYLFTLTTNKTLILNNTEVQKEASTYKSYSFIYSGVAQIKTFSNYDEGYYWVVLYKLSDVTGLTVEVNSDSMSIVADTWDVLRKLNDPSSIEIQISGSTTGVTCNFVILKITEDEYDDATDEELLETYCLGKIEGDITTQNVLITAKELEITNITTDITDLQTSLSYESNFSSDEIKELQQFKIEETWTDENHTEAIELFESGINKFIELNTPKNIIKMSIVNFLECIEEQINWDKLNLGDYVRVRYNKFNSDYTLQIIGFEFDYENNDIDVTLSNINSKVSNEEAFIRKIYKAEEATKKLNMNKIDWNSTAINFESRNDRLSTIPANPVIEDDGTTVDHVLNTDGSCNISFEWSFDGIGNAYIIDGFVVYVKTLDSDEPYVFGSSITKEQHITVRGDKRNYILLGKPCDQYYTFGIQAYRKVDIDISSSGVLVSDIVTPISECPYLPSAEVAFTGDVQGTIQGIDSDQVITDIATAIANAATALEVADGQIKGFYQNDAPTTGMSFGDIFIDIDLVVPPDTTCIFRYEDVDGGSQGDLDWYPEPENAIGIAFLTAYNFEATGDVIITFYQDGIPTSENVGDLWVDTNDNNHPYRAAVAEATTIGIGAWESMRDLGVTRSGSTYVVADGSTSNNILNADYVVPVGSTSAQETINAAINALPANGGRILLLEGTYIIDNPVVMISNSALEGQNQNTKIKLVDDYVASESSVNLLSVNQSNVETDTTGFTSDGASTITRVTTEHWQGAASLRVQTSSDLTGVYVETIGNGAETYTFSVYLKGSGTVVVFVTDDTFSITSSTAITLTSTWTRYSVSAILSSGATLYGGVDQTGSGTADYYIDGLQLEQASSATAWIAGQSSVLNGVVINSDPVDGNENISVLSLGIDGNKDNNTEVFQGVYFKKLITSNIDSLNIINMQASGLILEDSQNISTSNNIIDNCGSTNLHEPSMYLIGLCDSSITSNTIKNSTGDGIKIYSNESGTIVPNGNSIVSNIVTDNNWRGIYLRGYNNIINSNSILRNGGDGIYTTYYNYNIITNNTCQQNGEDGINVIGNENIISNNNCLENSQDGSKTYNNITVAGNYNNVQGNTCRKGALAALPKYGIYVTGTKNLVTNNDLYLAGETAAFLDDGTNTKSTAGNRVS